MIFLELDDLLLVAERSLGQLPEIRDVGLLESALARPRATVSGQDAYPSLALKAAALLHSVARNHALIDGNKRVAMDSVIAFLGLNGRRLTLTNGEAYDVVVAVATGALDDVVDIAAVLERGSARR